MARQEQDIGATGPCPALPAKVGADTWIVYAITQLLAHLLIIPILIGLAVRAIREPGHLRHLSHRIGLGPVGPKGSVWVYAACLGETRAASPLVRRLLDAGEYVVLSHNSPAGLALGKQLFAGQDRIVHRYVPIDFFWAVRLFLIRAKPKLGLVVEIEIWPAMLIEARRAGVPMAMVNGNLLEYSIARLDKVIARHVLKLYRQFTLICTRTDEYAERYKRVGVDADRIRVVGEMKYDQWVEPELLALAARHHARWAGDQPVFMIASSAKAEEAQLLRLIGRLTDPEGGLPGLKVVWVPRDPQRFQAVATQLRDAGYTIARRSDQLGDDLSRFLDPSVQILVGDSVGEMNFYYALADLVFVGASLNGEGGHNIMEPLALGRKVVMGPSIWGIEFAARNAAAIGVFESLPDLDALGERSVALLSNRRGLTELSQTAKDFAASGGGASDRTLTALKPFL